MGYRLGIDMGTTFTAAATLEIGDTQGSANVPTMVGLGNRALQVPSVLYLQNDRTFLVGEAAERRGQTEPSRVVRDFKRRLGDPVPLIVGGSPFSAQALSARLLSWVVATAIEHRGAEPDEIVLTHPANWGPHRHELLDQIIALAGIGPASICPEPQAAAIQYAAEARLDRGSRVLVYDLGGGTFDVCVLEKTAAGFTILGTPDGIDDLGGIDFDQMVFEHVVASLGAVDLEGPRAKDALSRLRRDCVEAKEALSVDVDTPIPVNLPGRSTSIRLTRGELETLITPDLALTMDCAARALRSAGTSPQRLTAIVLVGGSSRIPLVSHQLQKHFQTRTALDTHPKHAIALGAVQFTPPGFRPRPADRPTIRIPAVDEPTVAGPLAAAPTAAGPPATAPDVAGPPRTAPDAVGSPRAPRPGKTRTWADVTSTPVSASADAKTGSGRRRLLLLAAVVLAVAGITVAAVLFATRDKPAGDVAGPSDVTGSTALPTTAAGLFGVAVSPDNQRIYVSHFNSDALSVVDRATGRVTGTVPVGRKPLGVAVDRTNGDVYVANNASGTVTKIDGATLAPAGPPIKVGRQPQSIVLPPGTRTAYVTNVADGTVSVLDLSDDEVVATIRVGRTPVNLAADADGAWVYVANARSRSISVIDTRTNSTLRTFPVRQVPHDVDVSPDSGLLYVTSKQSSEIEVLETGSGAHRAPIAVGASASDLAVAPGADRLYATTGASVAVINLSTRAIAADPIPVGGSAGIALSADGAQLYVTADRTGLLTIDTATDRPVGDPVPVPTPARPSGSPT